MSVEEFTSFFMKYLAKKAEIKYQILNGLLIFKKIENNQNITKRKLNS